MDEDLAEREAEEAELRVMAARAAKMNRSAKEAEAVALEVALQKQMVREEEEKRQGEPEKAKSQEITGEKKAQRCARKVGIWRAYTSM